MALEILYILSPWDLVSQYVPKLIGIPGIGSIGFTGVILNTPLGAKQSRVITG